jgi:hypothetical protein
MVEAHADRCRPQKGRIGLKKSLYRMLRPNPRADILTVNRQSGP